jgi:hypothetical protein
MKIRILIAVIFLASAHATVLAQTNNGNAANDRDLKPRDYLRCQFTTAEEKAWRQDSPLDAAKQAVRTKVGTVDIKEKLGADRVATLMQSLESVTSRSELQIAVEKATLGESLKAAREELSRAAISAATDIAEYRIPPKDVACSQSILSYNETKDAFGTRVARTYVAVQVVVRNLDPDHEFVLHDVQVAVPIRDETSHFRAGRDRLIARGVAIKGQTLDPRNLLMGGLDTLSATASAASSIASADFTTGTSILTAFLPPLKRWFPDYTIDQLNRLNDLAFSATSSYKIVVPQKGSVPFVTFVPQELFDKSPKNWSRKEFYEWGNTTSVIVAGAHIQEVKNQNGAPTGK